MNYTVKKRTDRKVERIDGNAEKVRGIEIKSDGEVWTGER